jgi:hypothetical protein
MEYVWLIIAIIAGSAIGSLAGGFLSAFIRDSKNKKG